MADDLASMLMGVAPPQGGLSEMMRRNWEMRQPGPVWENNHAAPKKEAQRPADWAVTSGVAEAISPTMGAYGVGAGVGSTYAAAKAGDYGAAAESALPLAAMGIMPGPKGAKPARAVDSLGYYSGALEAARNLPQAKGTVEQMAAMLQKGGAKAGEIEATGLGKFLEGRPSVTRDDIVKHLEQNRLGLNEKTYHSAAEGSPAYQAAYNAELSSGMNEARGYLRDMPDGTVRVDEIIAGPSERGYTVMDRADAEDALRSFVSEGIGNRELQLDNPAKWQAHSLDPSNPTYRETVLHLPEGVLNRETPQWKAFAQGMRGKHGDDWWAYLDEADSNRRLELSRGNEEVPYFRQHHFANEPNVVGHMMTSMTKHEGKPVYTIDQIQSDWGQNIRDNGVKSTERAERLKSQVAEAEKAFHAAVPDYKTRNIMDYSPEHDAMFRDLTRLQAELRTAESGSPGHPLVNTTDQWTNTTLRRAIQQAIEAKAAGIAVPTGDTVLSYNPGDTAGMRGFYGSPEQRGIVPKNLANILQKMDPSIQAQFIQQLETPTKGMAGNGFNYFPLTDAAIAKAREGLPLFSMAAAGAGMTLPEFLQGQQPNQ